MRSAEGPHRARPNRAPAHRPRSPRPWHHRRPRWPPASVRQTERAAHPHDCAARRAGRGYARYKAHAPTPAGPRGPGVADLDAERARHRRGSRRRLRASALLGSGAGVDCDGQRGEVVRQRDREIEMRLFEAFVGSADLGGRPGRPGMRPWRRGHDPAHRRHAAPRFDGHGRRRRLTEAPHHVAERCRNDVPHAAVATASTRQRHSACAALVALL